MYIYRFITYSQIYTGYSKPFKTNKQWSQLQTRINHRIRHQIQSKLTSITRNECIQIELNAHTIDIHQKQNQNRAHTTKNKNEHDSKQSNHCQRIQY